MKRLLAGAIVAARLFVSTPCWACSCAAEVDPKEQARQAEIIFTGKAVAVDIRTEEDPFLLEDPGWVEAGRPTDRPMVVVRFDVEEGYKGHVTQEMVVRTETDGAACGFAFEQGKVYSVFGYLDHGSLRAGLCSATNSGRIDPSTFGLETQTLEDGAPRYAGPATVSPSPSEEPPVAVPITPVSDRIGWPLVAATAAGAIVAAFVVWRLLRRRRTPGEPVS